jgi:hypothetical protein
MHMKILAELLLLFALLSLGGGIVLSLQLQFGYRPGRRLVLSSAVAFAAAFLFISAAAVAGWQVWSEPQIVGSH